MRMVRAAYTGDMRFLPDGPYREGSLLVEFYVRLSVSEWRVKRAGEKYEGMSSYREETVASGAIPNPRWDETPLDYAAIAADLLNQYATV